MTQPAIVRFHSIKSVIKPLVVAVISALLAACGSPTPVSSQPTVSSPSSYRAAPRVVTRTTANTPNPNALLDANSLDELEGLLEATDMKMVENSSLAVQRYGNLWDRMRASFRMDESHYDPRIEAQKSWFISRQDYLNRLTARASRYLYYTVREAERRNIPAELALLPVIESSYDPLANSNAAAVGLWQFIPSTGRIYGLNQTPTFDGRRDVIESTRAAYDFLTSLYNQFGSWELALAAYNAGPGRIQSAINNNAAQGLPTDYWSLRLPTETMDYVPRFLAVAQIVKNPSNYGVYLPAIANRQHFRSVPANVGVTLSDISSLTGVDYDELRALNPGLIAGAVDMSGPNRVLIPNEISTSIDKRITSLRGNGFSSVPAYSASTYYPTETTLTPMQGYNMPSLSSAGANLATAQQAYNRTAASMPNSGALANYPTLRSGIINNTGGEPPISAAEQKEIAQEVRSEPGLSTPYTAIKTTAAQEPPLTNTQQMAVATAHPAPAEGKINLDAIQTQQSILDAKGETKQLSYDGGMTTPTATGTATPAPLETPAASSNETPIKVAPTPVKTKPRPKGTRSIYQVKKGDTLQSIAARAGINWKDIADWNQIDPNANLLYGTKLYLYSAKPMVDDNNASDDESDDTPDSYKVQAGDTLTGIANKYEIGLSELASYNNIPTNYAVRNQQTLWLVPGKVKPIAKAVVKPTSATQATQVKKSTLKTPTTMYKVQAGDSLIGLADEYDMSVSQLADMNDLEPTDSLLVGQILKVPANSASDTKSSPKASSKSTTVQKTSAVKPPPKNVTYKVKPGDSLTSLAKRYDVTPQELAKKNGLTPTANLIIGQTIKVPSDEDE